jgi:hypothetical protein
VFDPFFPPSILSIDYQASELAILSRFFTFVRCASGDAILRRGEEAMFVAIVLQGQLRSDNVDAIDDCSGGSGLVNVGSIIGQLPILLYATSPPSLSLATSPVPPSTPVVTTGPPSSSSSSSSSIPTSIVEPTQLCRLRSANVEAITPSILAGMELPQMSWLIFSVTSCVNRTVNGYHLIVFSYGELDEFGRDSSLPPPSSIIRHKLFATLSRPVVRSLLARCHARASSSVSSLIASSPSLSWVWLLLFSARIQ